MKEFLDRVNPVLAFRELFFVVRDCGIKFISPGLKREGREADHSPSISAEVKEM
jgi:hypothetical protein